MGYMEYKEKRLIQHEKEVKIMLVMVHYLKYYRGLKLKESLNILGLTYRIHNHWSSKNYKYLYTKTLIFKNAVKSFIKYYEEESYISEKENNLLNFLKEKVRI